jgi:valyl-tRNA synthetase
MFLWHCCDHAQDSATGKYLFGDAAAQALKDGKGETRWEKMSKSKGNGVEPSHIVREVGVDAARLNVLFKVRGCDRLLPPQSAQSRVVMSQWRIAALRFSVLPCACVCVCVRVCA